MNRTTRRFMNLSSGIEHQRTSYWCVNHSIASLLEAHFAMYYGKVEQLSNSWLMMLSKKDDFDKAPNAYGTLTYKALDLVKKYGCSLEENYPTWEDTDYFDNKFIPASEEDYKLAKRFQISSYEKFSKISDVLTSIEKEGGVVFDLKAYEQHAYVDQTGFINEPESDDKYYGYHAIYGVGYDLDLVRTMNGREEKGFFILQESYGTYRGFNGYLYMPIRYFLEKNDYIRGIYGVKTNKEKLYPLFHAKNIVTIPKLTIDLKVGSNTAIKNSVKMNLSQGPKIIDGRTMLPLRDVANLLGCTTYYNGTEKTIRIYNKQKATHINMSTLNNKACLEQFRNGKTVATNIELLTSPIVIHGVTFVGIRDIATLFDMDVQYYNDTKEVVLKGIL